VIAALLRHVLIHAVPSSQRIDQYRHLRTILTIVRR
jgi:hypothetical protein